MSDPRISVVICVRNGETLITEALDSVAAQQMPQIETLIVDDGSTDRTVEIAVTHPVAPIIIRQEAKGHAAALNAGVERVSGDFLCFLDHDDVWPQGRLHALFDLLQRDAALDAAFGHIVNTDERLQPQTPPMPARLITTMLIRREAFWRVGLFRTDVTHGANVDWISRAQTNGLRSGFLDQVVLWRRVHGENMGVRDRGTARGDMLRIIRDHHHRMRKA